MNCQYGNNPEHPSKHLGTEEEKHLINNLQKSALQIQDNYVITVWQREHQYVHIFVKLHKFEKKI